MQGHSRLLGMRCTVALVASLIATTAAHSSLPDGRRLGLRNDQVSVHLFEWSFKDIARECARLGKWGYAAVQISPIQEDPADLATWWSRYQPVSYKISSRSGTEAEFATMIKACRAAGVDAIVDVVINHMANNKPGFGRAGTRIISKCSYEGVYNCSHFHHVDCAAGDCGDCDQCSNCDVLNCISHDNPSHMFNCNLGGPGGLPDLDTSHPWVQQSIANFLSHLVDLGVAGVRVDAAKHINPVELQETVSKVKTPGLFVTQETMFFSYNCQCTPKDSYYRNGRIWEFHAPWLYYQIFSQPYNIQQIREMGNNKDTNYPCGGWTESDKAVVFVANHDSLLHSEYSNQTITMFNETEYRLALILMLAHPYGHPNILSSINFNPQDPKEVIDLAPTRSVFPDGCGHWREHKLKPFTCEHRWPEVRNMVAWRRVAGLSPTSLFDVYNNNTLVMTRGFNDTHGSPQGKAFVALNSGSAPFAQIVQTRMPAGVYCNVVAQGPGADDCYPCRTTCPNKVVVNSSGFADIALKKYQAVAFHVSSMLDLAPYPFKHAAALG